MEGEAAYWFENGAMKSLYNYKEKKLNGEVIHGYPNRKKKSACEFLNGVQDGVCTHWYKNGNKKSEAIFRNGTKMAKSERRWDENGKEIAKSNTTLVEKLILEEKIIATARTCANAKKAVEALKDEINNQTQYLELQRKEIQLNRIEKEENKSCRKLKKLNKKYNKIYSIKDAETFASKHGISHLLDKTSQTDKNAIKDMP